MRSPAKVPAAVAAAVAVGMASIIQSAQRMRDSSANANTNVFIGTVPIVSASFLRDFSDFILIFHNFV